MGHDMCGSCNSSPCQCKREESRSPSPTANERQIGGDHYRSEYQHWDFIEDNGIGYLEGCATKYATRWRSKDGLKDLEKALHYVDKLMEKHLNNHRLPRGNASVAELNRFCSANSLSQVERSVVVGLCSWACIDDLRGARGAINHLIAQCKKELPHGEDTTGQSHPFGYDGDG